MDSEKLIQLIISVLHRIQITRYNFILENNNNSILVEELIDLKEEISNIILEPSMNI